MSNLRVNDLEDGELRSQFNLLLEAMVSFDPDREEGTYEALNQRIYQEVTDLPILACIVTDAGESLLYVACRYLNLDSSHDVIKCLIKAYPSALLDTPQTRLNRLYTQIPIYVIVNHPEHCVLMPWIATNYTWVLDHEQCLEYPPVIDLIKMYTTTRPNSCTSATIKQFFEAYPRAFTQKRGSMTILHFVLKGTRECEADLFMWMAERCSSSLLLENNSLGNPLHLACSLLSKHKGHGWSGICKYLIRQCPAAVRMMNTDDELPIHILLPKRDYQVVREVLVCLFRVYPKSFDMQGIGVSGPPSSYPFIQGIKPHLDEEKELKETVSSLADSASSLTKALSCTNDTLVRSAFTVFDSWATSFINSTEDTINSISVKLQDMCNEALELGE